MDFEQALIYELKSIPSLDATWIGTVASWNAADWSWDQEPPKRVSPLKSPEYTNSNTSAFVIFSSTYGIQSKSLNGYYDGKSLRVEINAVAKRYAEMHSMEREIVELLISMEQRTIGVNGPYIQELTYQSPVELYEDKPKLYRCLIDFEVYF